MDKHDFKTGMRVRVTEGYMRNVDGELSVSPDDDGYDDFVAEVGKEGVVIANPEYSRYIRVRIDGTESGYDLYLPHELEVVEPETEGLSTAELAETLYNLIVIRGRWGGKPKPSAFDDTDDGTWNGLPVWIRETWKEQARKFARENHFNLTD